MGHAVLLVQQLSCRKSTFISWLASSLRHALVPLITVVLTLTYMHECDTVAVPTPIGKISIIQETTANKETLMFTGFLFLQAISKNSNCALNMLQKMSTDLPLTLIGI